MLLQNPLIAPLSALIVHRVAYEFMCLGSRLWLLGLPSSKLLQAGLSAPAAALGCWLLTAGRGVKLLEIPHNSDNGGKKWLRRSSNRCRATLRPRAGGMPSNGACHLSRSPTTRRLKLFYRLLEPPRLTRPSCISILRYVDMMYNEW